MSMEDIVDDPGQFQPIAQMRRLAMVLPKALHNGDAIPVKFCLHNGNTFNHWMELVSDQNENAMLKYEESDEEKELKVKSTIKVRMKEKQTEANSPRSQPEKSDRLLEKSKRQLEKFDRQLEKSDRELEELDSQQEKSGMQLEDSDKQQQEFDTQLEKPGRHMETSDKGPEVNNKHIKQSDEFASKSYEKNEKSKSPKKISRQQTKKSGKKVDPLHPEAITPSKDLDVESNSSVPMEVDAGSDSDSGTVHSVAIQVNFLPRHNQRAAPRSRTSSRSSVNDVATKNIDRGIQNHRKHRRDSTSEKNSTSLYERQKALMDLLIKERKIEDKRESCRHYVRRMINDEYKRKHVTGISSDSGRHSSQRGDPELRPGSRLSEHGFESDTIASYKKQKKQHSKRPASSQLAKQHDKHNTNQYSSHGRNFQDIDSNHGLPLGNDTEDGEDIIMIIKEEFKLLGYPKIANFDFFIH